MKDGSQNLGVWIAIGAGIGTALGVAMNNIGLWLAIGVAIGAALGAARIKKGSSKDDSPE